MSKTLFKKAVVRKSLNQDGLDFSPEYITTLLNKLEHVIILLSHSSLIFKMRSLILFLFPVQVCHKD